MNQKINFKKECKLKNYASKIEEITLTHDYKIEEDYIEGEFNVSGSYIVSSSSILKEDFIFKLPFMIAITNKINKETIDLTIENLDYKVLKDILYLDIELNLNYQNNEEKEMEDIINEEITKYNEKPEKEFEESKKKINNNIEIVKANLKKEDYSKYKIYIVRKEDTIESIAIKYNVSLETLKKYNNIESINTNDKIIIPFIENK